ncbi:hypothetical protein PROFUN_00003 [Planoprotostelium fungivorum]|uniref:Small EDRK-rich factor-like N-terminal domain-containing protein n=1 Tax=Planoprotostelium fungivorum TaxID=1890364 RepID=A0A2P6P0C6_9EUKA|nr:hypothetical protein PROFUN_00003 [Planoprotostelium fungivorum]
MARGHQKIQAQQKNAAKQQAAAKGVSQIASRAAALKIQCQICKTPLTNQKQLEEHYEAKGIHWLMHADILGRRYKPSEEESTLHTTPINTSLYLRLFVPRLDPIGRYGGVRV